MCCNVKQFLFVNWDDCKQGMEQGPNMGFHLHFSKLNILLLSSLISCCASPLLTVGFHSSLTLPQLLDQRSLWLRAWLSEEKS